MKQEIIIPEEIVSTKIYLIREQKVMLVPIAIGRDLAELYNVETRILKQAVRRNIKRFPTDFMFEMSEDEFKNWRSHFVMSKNDMKGLRHAPFCFTEQGVAAIIKINISPLCVGSDNYRERVGKEGDKGGGKNNSRKGK